MLINRKESPVYQPFMMIMGIILACWWLVNSGKVTGSYWKLTKSDGMYVFMYIYVHMFIYDVYIYMCVCVNSTYTCESILMFLIHWQCSIYRQRCICSMHMQYEFSRWILGGCSLIQPHSIEELWHHDHSARTMDNFRRWTSRELDLLDNHSGFDWYKQHYCWITIIH